MKQRIEITNESTTGSIVAWLFAGGLLIVVLIAAGPFLLFAIPIAGLIMLLYWAFQSRMEHFDKEDTAKEELAQRCTEQHNAIVLDGDLEKGTYGNYPPAVHTTFCRCDECQPPPHTWG